MQRRTGLWVGVPVKFGTRDDAQEERARLRWDGDFPDLFLFSSVSVLFKSSLASPLPG